MRFARVHKFAAYTLAVLGLTALCTGGELSIPAAIVLGAAVAATWFAEGELLQSVRYVRAWNVVVVVGLAVEVLRGFFTSLPPLSAAVQFAALLQLSRLANRRTARDYQQITVLAMLHLIAATVLGGGLSYAACFMGFVIVTPWAMTLGHLRREIEGNYLADARAGRAGVPIDVARILRSRRVVGPGLLVGSSLLAVPVFAMTAVIFVLFPRIGLGIFSIRPAHSNPVVGFGSTVDLRGHGTIPDDPTIVLRVEPPDLGSSPPTFRSFRLRGTSFDHYDGQAWSRSRFPNARALERGERGVYELRAHPDGPDYLAYRIVLDPLDPPVVLVPEGTVALRFDPRIETGADRFPDLTANDSGEIRYSGTDDLGLVYTAFVGRPDRAESIAPEIRELYLALPAHLPQRIVELAREITASHADRLTKAAAVEAYLRRFRYTLEIESGEAAQPLDDFLFRTRAGHCEYFSTAMAVLLRAVGVPTRNVTGFLGGVYNRWGRFYAVRQSDAHSWVEIYDEARGWVTFDPTPPSREPSVAEGGLLAEMDAMLEAMRVRWRRYIVSFDLRTQATLAMRVIRLFESQPRRGFTGEEPEHATERSWRVLRNAIVDHRVALGVALAASGAGVWFARRTRKRGRLASSGRRTPELREAIALARAFDVALEARGHHRPPSRSPMGFAEDLARLGSPLAPLARRVSERYAAARFGAQPLAPGEFESLRADLRNAPDPSA